MDLSYLMIVQINLIVWNVNVFISCDMYLKSVIVKEKEMIMGMLARLFNF